MRAFAALFLLFQTADYFADGSKALDEKRYQDAAQLFSKAVDADPKDYSAHFNLALAYGFLDNSAGAVAEYRKTLEIKPGLFEAETNLGLVYLRQKDSASAVPLFEDAARQKPQDFAVAYHLGEAESGVGAWDKPAAAFEATLALNPKSAPAEFGLARALARQDKLAAAAPHYRQAAALDPSFHDGLLELGSLYEKAGQTKEAAALYAEFPSDPAARQRLSALQLRAGQYADAIPNLEKAVAADPSAHNLIALGAAYSITNQNAKAIPLFEKAAAAEPGNFELRMMYARALRDTKQYPAAAAEFTEAVKLKPADAQAWSDLGAVLYFAGQYPQSLAAFDKARELGEDTPGNWFIRAITLDKMQQKKPALEAYKKFLDMSHGGLPDQEFQARQRARIIESELQKK